MDPKQQMKEVTVCIVSDTVFPDPNKCIHELTKMSTAQPNLIYKDNIHTITLWQKEVGQLNTLMSVMIREVNKLKMASLKVTFSQSPMLKNAIVIKVYVVAKLLYAETIKAITHSIFGDQLSTFVTIPPDVLLHLQMKAKTSALDVTKNSHTGKAVIIPDLFKRSHPQSSTNVSGCQILKPVQQTSLPDASPRSAEDSTPSKLPKLDTITNLREAPNNKHSENIMKKNSAENKVKFSQSTLPLSISFPSNPNFENISKVNINSLKVANTQLNKTNERNVFQKLPGNNAITSQQLTNALHSAETLLGNSVNSTNSLLPLITTSTATLTSGNAVWRQLTLNHNNATSTAAVCLSSVASSTITSTATLTSKDALSHQLSQNYNNATSTSAVSSSSVVSLSTLLTNNTAKNMLDVLKVKIKQEKVDPPATQVKYPFSWKHGTTTAATTMVVQTEVTAKVSLNVSARVTSSISLPGLEKVVPKIESEYNVSSIYSSTSTIDGEPTVMSDLPANILEKVDVFNRDQSSIQKENSRISNLLDGRGNICGFLLGKDVPSQSQTHTVGFIEPNSEPSSFSSIKDEEDTDNDQDEDDDDDESSIGFSSDFLQRRRRRKKRVDPTAHIGADTDELYQDPADVARRNWGHETGGVDSADTMFSSVPPPVVKKNELDELFDLLSEFPKDQLIEPCNAILRKMLTHQKMALHWMINRENTTELPPFWECITVNRDYFNTATRKRLGQRPSSIKGGILADDMGLGKTLTTIALILTNHKNEKPMFSNKKSLPTNASEIAAGDSKISIKRKKDGYKSTTKTEYSKPGFQFRQIYLQQVGKKKKSKKSKQKKKKASTTTTTNSSMFSSDSENEDKHVSKAVKNVLNSNTIADNSNSSPGSSTKKTGLFGQEPTDRKMTLIVCPMSVLSNWTDQFQEHVSPTINLQIYEYYGPDRVRDLTFLLKHDIILSTYGTVSGDYRMSVTKDKPSPLHKINWLRVILDEGHVIRNSRSQTTTAMMNLNSERRWLLTGTPIQNRMTDLWSMVKFLRLEPFTNRQWWFNYVVNSMKRQARPGELVYNRVQKLIKHVTIRRCKTDRVNGQPIVDLPERRVVIQKVKFNEDERVLYDAMHKDGKLVVCKYIRMGTVLRNYANVLVIIMRLRQLCCHPNLCINAVNRLQKALHVMNQLQDNINQAENAAAGEGSDGEEGDNTNNVELNDGEREKLIQQLMQLLTSGDSEECSICLEILQDPVITKCAHVFCSNCITEVIENGPAPVCPLCRADIDQASMVKVPESSKAQEVEENSAQKKNGNTLDVDDGQPWISSSKVDALMEALRAQRDSDPSTKTLVVSQFTSYLDLLQKPLRRDGFSFVRLDGKMSQGARVRVIDEFQKDDDFSPTIMLLSLTAGGVGLNLTAANRVFLLDPAWNPAVEEQCFDRAHRLGQTKNVLIIKFVVEDTVEDRMLILQKQKRELMEKAFGIRQQNPEERRAAALRDIATLLNIDIPRAVNPNRPL